jgi:hypothetical protein
MRSPSQGDWGPVQGTKKVSPEGGRDQVAVMCRFPNVQRSRSDKHGNAHGNPRWVGSETLGRCENHPESKKGMWRSPDPLPRLQTGSQKPQAW